MLETIQQLKSEGRFAAVNEEIPYAGFVGIECMLEEEDLVTVLRRRESNIGNPTVPALHPVPLRDLESSRSGGLLAVTSRKPAKTAPRTVKRSARSGRSREAAISALRRLASPARPEVTV